MKKYRFIPMILLILPVTVYAQRGCCSNKGGVCGCSADGRSICCNGGYSIYKKKRKRKDCFDGNKRY